MCVSAREVSLPKLSTVIYVAKGGKSVHVACALPLHTILFVFGAR